MRFTKGKWKASKRDTYHVNRMLSKVILAYLQELHSQLSNAKSCGVPMVYLTIVNDDPWSHTDGDIEKAHDLRMKELEELIWTFSDNEPLDTVEYEMKDGKYVFPMKCLDEEKRQRYYDDMKVWEERKKAGYKLFGERYQTLDW